MLYLYKNLFRCIYGHPKSKMNIVSSKDLKRIVFIALGAVEAMRFFFNYFKCFSRLLIWFYFFRISCPKSDFLSSYIEKCSVGSRNRQVRKLDSDAVFLWEMLLLMVLSFFGI